MKINKTFLFVLGSVFFITTFYLDQSSAVSDAVYNKILKGALITSVLSNFFIVWLMFVAQQKLKWFLLVFVALNFLMLFDAWTRLAL